MNKFRKCNLLMAAYKGNAFFPIFEILDVKPTFYVCRIVQVDNDYDKEGEEFIIAKDWDFMYVQVELEKF